MALLTDSDSARIEEAIARIEKRSAAECVVAVIPRSAGYPERRALIAGAWAVAAAIFYFEFVPWGGEMWGLLLQLPVAAVVFRVLGIPALHRKLIPPDEAERAVRAAAFRIFAEHGVHCTRDGTGILVLVSELERRAVLLGDTGVHERVGDAGWARALDTLLTRIREGRTGDGVLQVLESLEASLVGQFPVASDDTNELPNRVIRDL